VFRGVFEHQIDAKGRTSLPAKLRETLVGGYDERLILTTALDPCLHAYPVREWEQLEAALGKRNPMEPGVKTLMRLYVASAQEFWLDVTRAPPAQFRLPTLKRHNPRTVRLNVGEAYHGCLRIEVLRSGPLYKQIEGWCQAVMARAEVMPDSDSPS